MNRPSGFVPIPFHRVGKLLLIIGASGLLVEAINWLFSLVSIPASILIISLVLIALGLYLIFVVPRED